jgi:hypothetical protein
MSAIGAYEATLVCAAVFLALRPRLERDVRNLALVLAPFLVDVTFTKAALATSLLHAHGTVVAVAFGTATLAAALAEAAVAARAAGRRFDALEWCALGAAPLLATAFPIAGRLAEEHAPEAVLAGGAGLAALALLFAHVAARGAPASESLRRLAWIALPAAAWQAGAMTWTLEGELSLLAGPALIALGPALPWLAWPEDAARDRVTPFALPIVGALVCGAPGAWAFGAGAWTLGLVGCAAVHAVFALRTGGLHFVAGVAGAALLAAGGPTIAASLASIGRNPLEAALLLGLFGYGVARRAPPVALALLLGRGALVLARVLPLGAALDDVVALAVAGAGVLAFTHRVHGCGPAGRLLRLLGSTLLYAPACEVALDGGAAAGPARWIAALALAGLLAAGIRLRLPAYWAPPAVAPVVLATRRAPSSAIGWGATAIAAAFGAVGLGVALSVFRESILAWIGEERDGRDGAG